SRAFSDRLRLSSWRSDHSQSGMRARPVRLRSRCLSQIASRRLGGTAPSGWPRRSRRSGCSGCSTLRHDRPRASNPVCRRRATLGALMDHPSSSPVLTVALIHAVMPAMAPMREALASELPEARVLNLLDEGLLSEVERRGGLQPECVERLATQIGLAID